MMPPYPFFGFPNFRRPYSYNPYQNNFHTTNNLNNKNHHFTNSNLNSQQPNTTKNCNTPNNLQIDNCNQNSFEQCFEIFGFKLHFDDLLILALLFFLYQEEVKDTYLYMALILLLLS